jgi:hypothetical protein
VIAAGRCVTTAVVLLAATACGLSNDAAVADVAVEFYGAVEAGDGAGACALLAPTTRAELEQSAQAPCEVAVLEEDIPTVGEPRRTRRFGNQAVVGFGADTAFLAEFHTGWKVVAVACEPRPAAPYDCLVKGA